ncbi:MAG: hypothetical protein EU539_00345 [Promethearchaeota archaeon]|nr:MAG: hypothetical protein EU539_00345 [Candidatus Lokiarchaeota archaeon]
MKFEALPSNLKGMFNEIEKLEAQKQNLHKNLRTFQKKLFEKDNELRSTTDPFKKSILRLELSHLLREEDLYLKKIKNVESKIILKNHKATR